MGRHKNEDETHTMKQMAIVVGRITQKTNLGALKTWDDLWNVAYQWCSKNYQHSQDEAASWGVAPIYLLLTALLFVEHPLLISDGYMRFGWLRAMTEIIAVELERRDLPAPIKSTNIVNMGVERNVLSVDKTT